MYTEQINLNSMMKVQPESLEYYTYISISFLHSAIK